MNNLYFYTAIFTFLMIHPAASVSDVEEVSSPDVLKQEVEIGQDQELSWAGYDVAYRPSEGGQNRSLIVTGQDTFYERSGEEVFNVLGRIKKFDRSFYLRADDIDFSEGMLEATVWASEEAYGASELDVNAPEYIVKKGGDEFTLPLTVENKGGVNQTFDLSAESDGSVSTYFMYRGFNVTKVDLEPGEQETVTANLALEDEASGPVSINFSISDRSTSTEVFDFQVLEKEDEEERELRMALGQNYIEKSSGETIETSIRVENIGDSTVKDVKPEISTPGNWNYTLEPEQTENITEGQFHDFELSVSVPPTAGSGDYFIDAGLENTEDFDGKSLRVNVSDTSSGFGFIGLVMALMAILLVAGVYKVFGRR